MSNTFITLAYVENNPVVAGMVTNALKLLTRLHQELLFNGAASWLNTQKNGLYRMQDVLKL